jgi:hypothetical protein
MLRKPPLSLTGEERLLLLIFLPLSEPELVRLLELFERVPPAQRADERTERGREAVQ